MSNIVETISIVNVKHESSIYMGGNSGYTIWITFENLTAKTMELMVKEFYLVQDIERAYDFVFAGYMAKEACLLPLSKKTAGRIWYKSSLKEQIIEDGDYIVVELIDKTNKKHYLFRYDLVDGEWFQKYSEIRKLKNI